MQLKEVLEAGNRKHAELLQEMEGLVKAEKEAYEAQTAAQSALQANKEQISKLSRGLQVAHRLHRCLAVLGENFDECACGACAGGMCMHCGTQGAARHAGGYQELCTAHPLP